MQAELLLAALLTAALAGCAAPGVARPKPPPSASTQAAPPPPPMPAPPAEAMTPAPAPPAAPAPTSDRPAGHPVDAVLAYGDRVRGLPPAELAQDIQRLGEGAYTPARALQLVLALGQARTPGGAQRAQGLLQRVQQDPEALPLHPLARLLGAQFAEQRRLEDQAERQAQAVRENQRRIEQLNERLEAVRAIERSVPTRPRRDPPAAATAAPAPRSAPPARSATP